jgi:hypothetical protein
MSNVDGLRGPQEPQILLTPVRTTVVWRVALNRHPGDLAEQIKA